ncbi:LacI family DNA-binding transcriptional regulator [Bacillus sp. JJ1566]|uniref:LacI family DNA-binding transcriptional regulator n=1 Tax=Bacillus sp. JJ1566 TaxID=3122961 RepID=UPI002FFFC477
MRNRLQTILTNNRNWFLSYLFNEKTVSQFYRSNENGFTKKGIFMKITINDVAKHARVSKATVSRVINKNMSVNIEIRERVLDSIKTLGYFPNAFAKNLVKNTSNVIGLVLPDITNPYFPTVARGIEDAAHRYGYSLFIANTDNNPTVEREYIEKMISQQVGGIILISSALDDQRVQELESLNLPFVLCDRLLTNTSFDTVTIDNYTAAYEAVTRLINLGHTRICHLAGPKNVYSSERRVKGYLQAIREYQLEPIILSGDFNYESGYQLTKSMLKSHNPSAIFAGNDLIALGAMNAVQEEGFTIPTDISIVGFDDILFSQMSRPKLSTISVPAYQLGTTALDMLVDRIKGVRIEPKNMVLDYQFIQRETN